LTAQKLFAPMIRKSCWKT